MPKQKKSGETNLLIGMLEEAFNKPAWHGPNLRAATRRLSANEAMWRPKPGRHCIAEIVVHCAYWKYAARRRLRGDKRGSFPLKGSNWFPLTGSLAEETWKEHQKLLETEHEQLLQTVKGLPPSQLTIVPPSSKVTNLRLIYGMALHDVYHAGQIRFLKAMMQSKTNT